MSRDNGPERKKALSFSPLSGERKGDLPGEEFKNFGAKSLEGVRNSLVTSSYRVREREEKGTNSTAEPM